MIAQRYGTAHRVVDGRFTVSSCMVSRPLLRLVAAPTVRCMPLRPRVTRQVSRRDDSHDSQPMEDTDFDKETARLAVRMLTARAAGMVLQNISQVDTFRAQWLKDHFAHNPPIEGDTFITQLMNTKPVYSVDPYSGQTYFINPPQVSAAILATREQLAQKLAKNLCSTVTQANVDILRTHLEQHTYVSGSNNDSKISYRQYRKLPHKSQKQHH